jgi:hypothetical protein
MIRVFFFKVKFLLIDNSHMTLYSKQRKELKIMKHDEKTAGKKPLGIANTVTVYARPSSYIKSGRLARIAFGKCEVEEAVRLLVEFLAEADEWKGFTLEELGRFCNKKGKSAGEALFGLVSAWYDDGGFGCMRSAMEPPYIIQLDAKHFAVTTTFIEKLEQASHQKERGVAK